MRRPLSPRSLRRGSTTAASSGPMRQVPTGWKMVVPSIAGGLAQLGIRLDGGAGAILSGWCGAKACVSSTMRRSRRMASDGDGLVGLGRRDSLGWMAGRLGWIGRAQADGTAALRPEVAGGGGEGVEAVERRAEAVEAQRAARGTAGSAWRSAGDERVKPPICDGGHGHRATAGEAVLQRHAGLADEAVEAAVEGRDAGDLEDHPQLQMGPAGSRRRRERPCATAMPRVPSRAGSPMPRGCSRCGELTRAGRQDDLAAGAEGP